MLAVLLFYAAVILCGALVAAGFIHGPRLLLTAGWAGGVPRWALIAASYALSIGALRLVAPLFPGWLFLTGFVFVMSTLYHLTWLLRAVDVAARVFILAGLAFAVAYVARRATRAGALWPLDLLNQFARFFA